MCHYCDQNAKLTAQHAALVYELNRFEGGSFAQRESLLVRLTTSHAAIEANNDAGENDPAACELWKAEVTA